VQVQESSCVIPDLDYASESNGKNEVDIIANYHLGEWMVTTMVSFCTVDLYFSLGEM